MLIRSTTTPGEVNLKATATGLKEATIILITQPFKEENGLATLLPSGGLPSNLHRGPTPSTPSFKAIKSSAKIVAAKAGANIDSAFASFDDNELSDWHNDGNLSTAWIEYELENETLVTEVGLKLNNFRTRTYPLRITVDGQEVYNDTTQKTLGYFTAVCKPQKGKKVRIQLMRSSNTIANNATEVSGKKLDDGVTRDDANAKGTLSIIEADIYEAVRNK
jgi:hypothetical protein